MERIEVRENTSFQESEALVEVVSKEGAHFRQHITTPRGDPRNPLGFEEIVAKFRDLCKGLLNDRALDQIVSMVQGLEKLENIPLLLKMCFSEYKP